MSTPFHFQACDNGSLDSTRNEFSTALASLFHPKPKIDPAKVDTLAFAETLVEVTENLNQPEIIITHDKYDVSLRAFVSLATFSHMPNASAAQHLPRGSGHNQAAAEPDCLEAYSATRSDRSCVDCASTTMTFRLQMPTTSHPLVFSLTPLMTPLWLSFVLSGRQRTLW